MGFSEWFEDTKKQVTDAFEEYKPVIESTAITWLSENLNKQKEESQKKANEVIKSATSGPPAPAGTLSSALQGVLGQGVLDAKGPQILLVVLAIGAVGFLLAKGAK